MTDKPIVMRAQLREGVTRVKVFIPHPMERGTQTIGEQEAAAPPHFIQEVICESADRILLTALLSGDVAKNPFLAFSFRGGETGDKVKVTWVDNRGNRGSAKTSIE
jgi:sulfur-oxidizing protein SoxZ